MVYFVSIFVSAIIYNHPLYLGVLLVVIGASLCGLGKLSSWKSTLSFALSLSLLIFIINIFVSRNGSTILFESAPLPLYGRVFITKEAVIFSLIMGLKLTVILSFFTLYNVMLLPDRAFHFFSRLLPSSAIIVTLSTMFIPTLQRRALEAADVLRNRGFHFEGKGLKKRISSQYPVLKILLLSALEDSWETAEALHARGFGSGKRTVFYSESWRIFDSVLVASSLLTIFFLIGSFVWGEVGVRFFPLLKLTTSVNDLVFLAILAPLWVLGPTLQVLLTHQKTEVEYGAL